MSILSVNILLIIMSEIILLSALFFLRSFLAQKMKFNSYLIKLKWQCFWLILRKEMSIDCIIDMILKIDFGQKFDVINVFVLWIKTENILY